MKRITQTLFFILTLSITIQAQVTEVKYQLEYDFDAAVYTCNLVIVKGKTTNLFSRIQASSQLSIVVPTGTELMITETYNPNGESSSGEWIAQNVLISYPTYPDIDIYGMVPSLSPTKYYEELTVGDIVPLFSFVVGNKENCYDDIRLYDNDTGPTPFELNGPNFIQAFRIGPIDIIYKGNQAVSETSIREILCVGSSLDLSSPSEGEWTTSNDEVINIDQNGILTAISPTERIDISHIKNNNSCIDQILYFTIVEASDPRCLSSSTEILEERIALYPNPVSDILQVDNLKANTSINIVDILGRTLYSTINIKKNEISIDVSNWENGTYFFYAENERRKQGRIVIVNHN